MRDQDAKKTSTPVLKSKLLFYIKLLKISVVRKLLAWPNAFVKIFVDFRGSFAIFKKRGYKKRLEPRLFDKSHIASKITFLYKFSNTFYKNVMIFVSFSPCKI